MASAQSVVIGSMGLNQSGLNRICTQSSSLTGSLFVGTRQNRHLSLSCTRRRRGRKSSSLVVVAEIAGQYEDAFEDVDQKCDHAKMYERISEENLQLMRERLMETIIWPTDDTTTEKIGDCNGAWMPLFHCHVGPTKMCTLSASNPKRPKLYQWLGLNNGTWVPSILSRISNWHTGGSKLARWMARLKLEGLNLGRIWQKIYKAFSKS